MKKKQLQEILGWTCVVNSKKELNTFRGFKSFFYRHGMDSQKLSDQVVAKLTEAGVKVTVIDRGEHWHGFVGGAKSGGPMDSYFWVIFKVEEGVVG